MTITAVPTADNDGKRSKILTENQHCTECGLFIKSVEKMESGFSAFNPAG
jgi:hypothetical protein